MTTHSKNFQLLVVEDTFTISGRGIIIAPEVPIHHLPDRSPQQIIVEVRVAGAAMKRFEAEATVPFVDPPDPCREIAFTLLVRGATREDIPIDSELWLIVEETPTIP